MSEEITIYQTEPHDASVWRPVMAVAEIANRQNAIAALMKNAMKKDLHYGVIPGTGKKPTLLKAGAEMLTTFFGLSKSFTIVERIEDWLGEQHGGTQFFYYLVRCHLRRGDTLIAEADGSCNSMESKYRYRWEYKGSQKTRVPNDDLASTVNTILKMASKRALVAATLLAVGASDFFTQDIEDMAADYVEADYTVTEPEGKSEPPPKPFASQTTPARINGKTLTPETLKASIAFKTTQYADKFGDSPAPTDAHRKLMSLLRGFDVSDEGRHHLLGYLLGKDSSKTLTAAETQAVTDWLSADRGMSTAEEIDAVIVAALAQPDAAPNSDEQ